MAVAVIYTLMIAYDLEKRAFLYLHTYYIGLAMTSMLYVEGAQCAKKQSARPCRHINRASEITSYGTLNRGVS